MVFFAIPCWTRECHLLKKRENSINLGVYFRQVLFLAFFEQLKEIMFNFLVGGPISLDVKVETSIAQLRKKATALDKYIFMHTIQDSDETLFYALLVRHTRETMPFVYTPTVGININMDVYFHAFTCCALQSALSGQQWLHVDARICAWSYYSLSYRSSLSGVESHLSTHPARSVSESPWQGPHPRDSGPLSQPEYQGFLHTIIYTYKHACILHTYYVHILVQT